MWIGHPHMVGCRLATLNAVVVPFAREYRKFPVNSLLAGNSAFRDGFARDCLLQRRVVCEPEETTSTFWCRVPPRFKAYLEADRAEEAQRLLVRLLRCGHCGRKLKVQHNGLR